MNEREMARDVRKVGQRLGGPRLGSHDQIDFHNSNLLYKKKGADIKASLETVVAKILTRSEEMKSQVAKICKRRELDPKEVLDAGDDEVAVSAYSTKAESSLGASRAQGPIRELQDDLSLLRSYVGLIERMKWDVENIQRVQKHIEPTREFDLTFYELTSFGFVA